MKKNLLLFTALVAFILNVSAQDVFQVDKLFYTITSTTENTVKVVPSEWPSAKYLPTTFPVGDVVIPKTITHPLNGNTYTVTELGKYAFAGGPGQHDHPLKSVYIPNTILRVDSFAFRECRNLESVEFEAGSKINRLYRSTFEYCGSLKSITLPPLITVIEDWAFLECSNLEEITLPSSIKVIYEFAFRDLPGLYDIYLPADFPPTFATPETDRDAIPGWVFYGTPINDIILYVPTGKKSNYTGYPWDAFLEIVEKTFPAAGTGVQKTTAHIQLGVERNGNSVTLTGLTAGENLEILDITGKVLFSQKTNNNSETILLNRGIYIVKHDGNVGKINL